MEIKLNITGKYLGIPIKTAPADRQELRTVELFVQDKKVYEFKIPMWESPCDYYAYLEIGAYEGSELVLRGDFPDAFFEELVISDDCSLAWEIRPELHFTAERGWMNDPNGLVYLDGNYHLYYQYNPMNTEWENMSWGHGVSKDLIHWEHRNPAMYPDAYGTMYSGCGLVNERGLLHLPKDALLFFYTAAGGNSVWSKHKPVVQRLAYSLDGGLTMHKHETWQMDHIAGANRDPKVFWHEESNSYIMVLFLDENEFALFRSSDLEQWEKTQVLDLPKAWECPDLFKLKADDGTSHWVFWSADGYYFVGSFDGWKFIAASERMEAYGTPLPYAAQTYAGVEGDPISVAWLRTQHQGHLYKGAMAIPRSLSLVKVGKKYRISLRTVAELNDIWEPFEAVKMINGCAKWELKNRPCCLNISWPDSNGTTEDNGNCLLEIGKDKWEIQRLSGVITYNGISFKGWSETLITDMQIIIDRGLVEITANHAIIYLVYETTDYHLENFASYSGSEGIVEAARVKA